MGIHWESRETALTWNPQWKQKTGKLKGYMEKGYTEGSESKRDSYGAAWRARPKREMTGKLL